MVEQRCKLEDSLNPYALLLVEQKRADQDWLASIDDDAGIERAVRGDDEGPMDGDIGDLLVIWRRRRIEVRRQRASKGL